MRFVPATARGQVDAWIAGDPDPAARDELRAVADRAFGDHDAHNSRARAEAAADLDARFSAPLSFGTAGLRGPLRAGPAGMNTAVVVRATAGLASYLSGAGEDGATVVVGRDARHGSEQFARAAAAVLSAAGFDVVALPEPLPTPVTAFAVRALGAAAGVQVTASHNPAGDNGYKVYLRGGAQLVPPADDAIESAILQAAPASQVPRRTTPGSAEPDPRCAEIVEAYLRRASAAGRSGQADQRGGAAGGPLRVALTPMHGVGGRTAVEALRRAGIADVHVVDAQFAPDPDFPTAPLPNPEEPGAADLLLALAAEVDADLAIALDPDADRCALGIRGPDGWRMLRGDETGTLLAEHILPAPHFPEVADAAGPAAGGPLVATTIVSSTLLGRIAAARGARHRTTLTGFKWLVRAGDGLVYAYEEALGICVDPDAVRDKDGISAAVALCRMVAGLRARERTVADELNRLAAEFGVHAGTQVSVRVQTLETIRTLMEQLRSDPPRLLARTSVTSEDLLRRDDHLHTDALVFEGGLPDADRDGAGLRLVIRPSGTEPKIKAYLEVTMPPADDVESARARAAALLDDAASDVRRMLASASG